MVLKADLTPRSLLIDICSNGLYAFIVDGGMGKSYLYHMLSSSNLDKTYCVTYNSNASIMSSYIEEIFKSNAEFILLDRADLYMNDDLLYKLVDKSKECVIALDFKSKSKYKGICFRPISVSVEESEVKVF